MLHVELFTGDDLAQSISRSRAGAQQLDAKSRTLLLISAGAKLVQPAPQDTSISGSVKETADSPSAGPWCKVHAVDAAGHPVPEDAHWDFSRQATQHRCTFRKENEESLIYRDGHRLWGVYRSALVAGLRRLNPTWTEAQMRTYTETHLANNDAELGKVLFGNSQYPDVDYRGRGPLAVTWDTTYSAYQADSGTTVMPNPRLFATDSAIGCDSSAWFWEKNGISTPADKNSLHDVTHIINKALLRMHDRGSMAKRAFTLLNGGNNPCAESWHNALTVANGWAQ